MSAWGAWFAALAAFLAVAAGLYGTWRSARDTRSESLRSEQLAAYGDYIGSLSKFNEFIWANLWWAGSDKTAPSDLAQRFWAPAQSLEAELEANFGKAKMLSSRNPAVDESLTGLDTKENVVLRDFKCMSGQQTVSCPVEEKTNSGLQSELGKELDDLATARTTFATKTADDLGKLPPPWNIPELAWLDEG